MIDYVKIQLYADQHTFIQILLSNGFEVSGNFDYDTGEAREYPLIARKKNLEVIFKSENFVQLSGSIHKFEQDGKNHTDFSINQVLEAFASLIDLIALNPLTSRFHNIEFGVNINPSFVTKAFLKQVISYGGTSFTPMKSKDGNSLGIQCQLTQFRIKMYCKKSQYSLTAETMRFEIHVEKMQFLTGKKIPVRFLCDLFKVEVFATLGNLLCKIFSEIIIIDKSIDASKLSKPESKIYEIWSNPLSIEALHESDIDKFQRQRRQYRKIQNIYSKENHQQIAAKLIEKKVNQLLSADEKTSIILTDFQNRFSNANFNHSYPSYKRADSFIIPSPVIEVLPSNPIEQSSPLTAIIKEQKRDGKIGAILIETSFLGTDGKFYIPNPINPDRIAVYDSPEAYDRRLHIPEYVAREEAEKFFLKPLPIDLATLQTIGEQTKV